MKREHSYLLGLAAVVCFSLYGCVSTLTWKVEPIKCGHATKAESVKVDAEKKDTAIATKKKRIDIIRDTENGEWNRMIPPIK